MMKKLSALSQKKLWLLLTAGLLAILVVMGSACAKKEPVDTSIAKSVLGDTVTLHPEDISMIIRRNLNYRIDKNTFFLSEEGVQAYHSVFNEIQLTKEGVPKDFVPELLDGGPSCYDEITFKDSSKLTYHQRGEYVILFYNEKEYVYRIVNEEKANDLYKNFTDYSKRTPRNDPVLDAQYYEQEVAPYYHPEYFRE
ncbi:MAG: hypothetical protein IIY12_03820 [Clostridia bacterium]|nr:hypothetical protein [Clostridia bacterium]